MDIAYTRCTCRHIVDTAKVYMDIGIANRNKRHPHVVYILLIIKFYHQLIHNLLLIHTLWNNDLLFSFLSKDD